MGRLFLHVAPAGGRVRRLVLSPATWSARRRAGACVFLSSRGTQPKRAHASSWWPGTLAAPAGPRRMRPPPAATRGPARQACAAASAPMQGFGRRRPRYTPGHALRPFWLGFESAVSSDTPTSSRVVSRSLVDTFPARRIIPWNRTKADITTIRQKVGLNTALEQHLGERRGAHVRQHPVRARFYRSNALQQTLLASKSSTPIVTSHIDFAALKRNSHMRGCFQRGTPNELI